MANEMIERLTGVVIDIEIELREGSMQYSEAVAKILTAMREPTEAMLNAGGKAGGKAYEYTGDTIVCAPVFSWPAMIDAALARIGEEAGLVQAPDRIPAASRDIWRRGKINNAPAKRL